MAKSNSHITIDNMTEWMASTGFLFPRNLAELTRFRKLYDNEIDNLEGRELDPDVILGKKERGQVVALKKRSEDEGARFRLAARKGDPSVPKHIMDKIKKNQDKRKQDDSGAKEENS